MSIYLDTFFINCNMNFLPLNWKHSLYNKYHTKETKFLPQGEKQCHYFPKNLLTISKNQIDTALSVFRRQPRRQLYIQNQKVGTASQEKGTLSPSGQWSPVITFRKRRFMERLM